MEISSPMILTSSPALAAPALYQNYFVLWFDGQLTLKVNPGEDDNPTVPVRSSKVKKAILSPFSY